jgi:hypothetical protein
VTAITEKDALIEKDRWRRAIKDFLLPDQLGSQRLSSGAMVSDENTAPRGY